MTNKIKGSSLVVTISQNLVNQLLMCARTCTMTTTTEIIEKTTKGSGSQREFKAIATSSVLTADGLVVYDTGITLPQLKALQIALATVSLMWEETDLFGNGIIYTSDAVIQSIQEMGAYNDVLSYKASFQLTGPLTTVPLTGLPGDIYYGVQATNANPTDFTRWISADPTKDISIQYGSGSKGFFWMAHPLAAPRKTNYEDLNNTLNAGLIGGDSNLFTTSIVTIDGEDYFLYMCNYVTTFTGNETVLFSRPDPNPYPYSNTPVLFRIFTKTINYPVAGETTLNLSWDEGYIAPLSYTLQASNLSTGVTEYVTGITALDTNYIVTNGQNYQFKVRAVYDYSDSDWTAEISYP